MFVVGEQESPRERMAVIQALLGSPARIFRIEEASMEQCEHCRAGLSFQFLDQFRPPLIITIRAIIR